MVKALISFFKNMLIFAACFACLSLPIYLFPKKVKVQKVAIHYPNPGRKLASIENAMAEVAKRNCEPAERWQYLCDDDQKNCVKEKLVSYLKCKSLKSPK